jgi:hypothetical protein
MPTWRKDRRSVARPGEQPLQKATPIHRFDKARSPETTDDTEFRSGLFLGIYTLAPPSDGSGPIQPPGSSRSTHLGEPRGDLIVLRSWTHRASLNPPAARPLWRGS